MQQLHMQEGKRAPPPMEDPEESASSGGAAELTITGHPQDLTWRHRQRSQAPLRNNPSYPHNSLTALPGPESEDTPRSQGREDRVEGASYTLQSHLLGPDATPPREGRSGPNGVPLPESHSPVGTLSGSEEEPVPRSSKAGAMQGGQVLPLPHTTALH